VGVPSTTDPEFAVGNFRVAWLSSWVVTPALVLTNGRFCVFSSPDPPTHPRSLKRGLVPPPGQHPGDHPVALCVGGTGYRIRCPFSSRAWLYVGNILPPPLVQRPAVTNSEHPHGRL
jgi:hypothetical protein